MSADANQALTPPEHRSALLSPSLSRISPLEYALTKNGSVSVLECALSNSLNLKSSRMRTYEERVGGTPLCAQLLLSGGSLLSTPARRRPHRMTRHTRTTLRHAADGPALCPAGRSWYVGEAAPQDFPTRPGGSERVPRPFAGAPRLARDKRCAPLAGSFQREEKTHEQQARA